MTSPAAAAGRFAAACLMGLLLGLLYGFLRPLRRTRQAPADLLFLAAAGWAWLYLGFKICRGDLRPAYTFGLLAGALAEELTLGALLRPVFAIFWKYATLPGKKISKNAKILFASAEKWVTIRWSNRRHRRHRSGGTPNGKHHQLSEEHSAGLPPQQQSVEDLRHRHPHFRYPWSFRPASGDPRHTGRKRRPGK